MYPRHPDQKSGCTIGPAQTRQTTHPATAATIVRNLPTTPTSRASCASARPLAKHNTNKKSATAATIVRNLPTHPQSRAAPAQHKHNTNKSQQRPQQFCGIYPHTHKVALHHRPKHNNTNKSRQRPATAATIVRNLPTHPQSHPQSRAAPSPQTQHKQKPAMATTIVQNLPTHPQVALHHRPKPNTTTQTKAGNGCNDCAEFTHAPTSRAAPSPQTQHKQKPAMATMIVRNLPMHPQSRCTVGPNTTQTKNNPATAALIMRNFRTVDTKSQRAKTS